MDLVWQGRLCDEGKNVLVEVRDNLVNALVQDAHNLLVRFHC